MSEATAPVTRHDEWHITVEGVDPIDWYNFCHEHYLKPLFIELSTMALQMMCGTSEDPVEIPEAFGATFPKGRIVRIKHETNVMTPEEMASYYECHVKIDGPMMTNFTMSSRDLYRGTRWYITKRSVHPFDADAFYRSIQRRMEYRANQTVLGFEYEVCVQDTNPGLDTGWVR